MANEKPPANPVTERFLEARRASPTQQACQHQQFSARVDVMRMEDTGRFLAEVHIHCILCELPFEFVGPPAGIAWDRPTVDITGLTLHAPIEPAAIVRLRDGASFQVPPELHGSKH